MLNLKQLWTKLASNHTSNNELIQTHWKEIEAAYSSKERHYHSLAHLEYMLSKLKEVETEVYDLNTFQFSIFYHDIIYNVKRQDNEEKSAELAKERLDELGISKEKIDRCVHQIIATKEHNDNGNKDVNLLVDIDLAVLGGSEKQYADYAKNVRKEYSIYPNILYNRGRRKVLKHFLDMEAIYKTEHFKAKCEQIARNNLMQELKSLS